MATKKRGYPNVEPREKSIRIKFEWRGIQCRETLPIPPTPHNLKAAHNRLTQINSKIVSGIFDYAAEFPKSPTVKRLGLVPEHAQNKTFGEVALMWLQAASCDKSKGTMDGYRRTLDRRWLPLWRDTPIAGITYSALSIAISGIRWASPKSRNNELIPLRGVFDMAWRDGLIPTNITERIRNQKNQQDPPDPLNLDEVDVIIGWMTGKYGQAIADYFEFSFFTGLRPEEQIAVIWGDVDWRRSTIRVQRAQTAGELKGVKTGKVRDVDLNARALAALTRQKSRTFLAGKQIWINPVTNNPWNDNGKAQRVRYWTPALKATGIRHRRMYETRHTYATMLLMAGNNPAYAAKQMGHSVVVFLNVYARWIDSESQRGEKAKIERFISSIPDESLNIGNK